MITFFALIHFHTFLLDKLSLKECGTSHRIPNFCYIKYHYNNYILVLEFRCV